jgi:ubiquinone/menaquinone biosynthesis C-methylase UbiE
MTGKNYKVVSDFYDQVYYKETQQIYNLNRYYRTLAKKMGIKPGEKVLDIACGTGSWLMATSDFGADIHGVDISDRAIEIGKNSLPNSTLKVGTAENLPFPDAYFDLVTCLGALEHFLDQPKAIKEMIRVAKPTTRFLILVPNSGFLTYRLGLFKGTQQQTIKETINSLDEWEKLFNQQGLTTVNRWADTHVLSRSWILRKPYFMVIPRLIQALLLMIWPLNWQYQVFHLCRLS